MSASGRAAWWRLILLVLLAGGAFVVEESVTASAQAHAIMQVAIFLVTIGLMALCMRSTAPAETREAASRLIVIDMLDANTPAAPLAPRRLAEPQRVRHHISNS